MKKKTDKDRIKLLNLKIRGLTASNQNFKEAYEGIRDAILARNKELKTARKEAEDYWKDYNVETSKVRSLERSIINLASAIKDYDTD